MVFKASQTGSRASSSDLTRISSCAGPVCPFVPESLDRKTLWLAPAHIAERGVPEVVELMSGYKKLLLDTQPIDGDDIAYKVVVVVFTDFDRLLVRKASSLTTSSSSLQSRRMRRMEFLFGPFYEGNEGTAGSNASFRPFQSPVPFLFVGRFVVVSDWKFFLDDDAWLKPWAQR